MMKYELRPYQQEAVEKIYNLIPEKQFILLQAAVAAGKTIMISFLIKKILELYPNVRIAFLAHRGILVEQAVDKLKKVWPEAAGLIGIASGGIDKNVDHEKNITIGTIQTLAKKSLEIAPYDIIVIDECHYIPPKNKKSQYQSFIKQMIQYNKNVRVVGITGTPFRLGNGYCYGTVCKPQNENWFDSLDYNIGIKKLLELGFLCPYRAKEAKDMSSELRSVKINGDYQINELSDLMIQERHVGSAVKAFEDHARDRKHIVVFAVTIEHAESLAEAFKDAGYTAMALHSKLPKYQQDLILREFESGKIRFLVNVAMATEGYDCPAIDCIIMCRPTKSPALYCQIFGRGLRIFPGKKDLLVLDLSSNCTTHGDPNNPKIIIPGHGGNGEPVQKSCPKCFELVYNSARTCPECGFVFPIQTIEYHGDLGLVDVQWKKEAPKPEPFLFNVTDYEIKQTTSKSGNDMIRVTLSDSKSISGTRINTFLMFDRSVHPYARGQSIKTWKTVAGTDAPEDTDDAMGRIAEFEEGIPEQVEVVEDGKYLKVKSWNVKNDLKYADDIIPF